MKTIILAGGSGTRLWPLSREGYPKQFIKFQGRENSLFQETFKRSLLISELDDIYVVTSERYKSLIINAVEEMGHVYNEKNILVEPEAKNTLPAIYAGVNEIIKREHDSIVVFPSDHIIEKGIEFSEIIKESEHLTRDAIITFGVKPNAPNTGYGYIAPGERKMNGFSVKNFKEKPSKDKAKEYINQGYLWNAGIFMFNSKIFSEEVKRYSPEIFSAFEASQDISEAFSKIKSKISIDYGIMEKSDKIAVVPVDIAWNDLGSFDSFYDIFEADRDGNVSDGDNILLDSRGNLIQSYNKKVVTTIDIENLIIIDSKDSLLICKKGQSQKVRDVVEILKNRNDSRIEYYI